jgi:hypothetical protein
MSWPIRWITAKSGPAPSCLNGTLLFISVMFIERMPA